MSSSLDLVFAFRDESRQTIERDLTDLGGATAERWILRTRDAGVAWVVRRRRVDVPAITCVARGYQELLHWPLTTYSGSARDPVAIERETSEIRLIVRREVLGVLRALPWGQGAIDQYDWRLTFRGNAWRVEARRGGQSEWQALARRAPVGVSGDGRSSTPILGC